jgi:hypothetical protein
MAAMTAIAETPATASRRLCLRADVGDWGLILVIMMCSFDVIGALFEPLTQAGAPSPVKGDTFSRIDLSGACPHQVRRVCDEWSGHTERYYRASDGQAVSALATVTITVTAVPIYTDQAASFVVAKLLGVQPPLRPSLLRRSHHLRRPNRPLVSTDGLDRPNGVGRQQF